MVQAALICLVLSIASWEADEFAPSDLDACFATVFEKLPDEVTVYPSENYYYWKMVTPDGKETCGNLRLAAEGRDRGELSFAAGAEHKIFTAGDGVGVDRLGRFEYAVTYQGKRVAFHLNRLSQDPPEQFALRQGERFVQRTYDESGLQFILIYSTRFKDFFWVLNQEDEVELAEKFREQDGALVGERSGFVFWQDDDRRVLVAVSAANIAANNEYDGPFDQLADNYAGETPLLECLLQRQPNLDGQIDRFGRYMNRRPVSRVALTNYLKYAGIEEATSFLEDALRSRDPYRQLSKGGAAEKEPSLD